uniref:Uncharacterized protein n=1 Tax=Rousettus aegyptiacus TaxID=9407 RepID=A0A7J8GC81_ROUAE|nr:hypothetical protein HJG63_011785 [Rousettus aegyptiacus]
MFLQGTRTGNPVCQLGQPPQRNLPGSFFKHQADGPQAKGPRPRVFPLHHVYHPRPSLPKKRPQGGSSAARRIPEDTSHNPPCRILSQPICPSPESSIKSSSTQSPLPQPSAPRVHPSSEP